MTTVMNDKAESLPPKDFLIKDYELKVGYLTQHFSRMWTRFNYFVGIESALVGGKLIFGSGKLSLEVAIVGAIVSLIWYDMGAEDRFCWCVSIGGMSRTPPLCLPRQYRKCMTLTTGVRAMYS